MPKRSQGRFAKPKKQEYDSDDERAYENIEDPDPQSREFMYDEVDEFHADKEKILLDHPSGIQPADTSDSEDEEVLNLELSEDDEDFGEDDADISSDELEDQNKDNIPDSKAWGKKKNIFYHTDYVDDDLPGLSESDEEAARDEEEQEALALQQRMAETLQEEDFGMELFKVPTVKLEVKKTDKNEQEKVIKDLTKLAKREKLELLKKESPELLELIDDFKIKLREVIDKLQPLMNLLQNDQITDKGAMYIKTKYKLYLNYCINISFYMILKSRHTPIHNHPVIGRLVAYRNLIKQLEPLDKKLEPEITTLLAGEKMVMKTKKRGSVKKDTSSREDKTHKKIKAKKLSSLLDESDEDKPGYHGDEENVDTSVIKEKKTKKRKASKNMFTSEELEALRFYESMRESAKKKKIEVTDLNITAATGIDPEELEKMDPETKRAITYEMAKNKGLTPKRKKSLRNPRVKHREKYRKAKIRRKGQVREVRKEVDRYGGEISGIRAGVIKSIKLKT
ncbi:something about silencing protein 10-like isoform X2 [Saccoglossus kowalevskii]|uniref:Something about silencing protein 10-like isoform X2 n=1 Tax=Saccoglossus kowalevskii TaxID=10224 RepID=A0ABM0M5N1_SACKO|nr:PREDICTED: something about silencing protein 10-like isoform X2 [Saccoglossus kowalevskii]